MSPTAYAVDSETANAPMMEASSSATANTAPATRPAWAAMPWASPAASVKWPAAGVPAKAAAVAPISAAAPTTTITMPIHRSTFS